MDADSLPLVNPEHMFEWPEFQEAGSLFWPDYVGIGTEYVSPLTIMPEFDLRAQGIFCIQLAARLLSDGSWQALQGAEGLSASFIANLKSNSILAGASVGCTTSR